MTDHLLSHPFSPAALQRLCTLTVAFDAAELTKSLPAHDLHSPSRPQAEAIQVNSDALAASEAEKAADEKAASTTEEEAAAKEAEKPASAKIFPEEVPAPTVSAPHRSLWALANISRDYVKDIRFRELNPNG